MPKTEEEIKSAVRRHYASLAIVGQGECCNAPSSDTGVIPKEALAVCASCGSPLGGITLQGNETILDLGSGGGIDVFRASKALGSAGKVIGVDATPEMIWKARETAKKYDYKNVEFRLGEIENIPVESGSVDLVVSNCVLNLVPDKMKAFAEIHRVLKPGGRIAISDMVAVKQITPEERANLQDWSACITGAITVDEYKQLLSDAGFVNVSYVDEVSGNFDSSNRVVSLTWTGIKPTS